MQLLSSRSRPRRHLELLLPSALLLTGIPFAVSAADGPSKPTSDAPLDASALDAAVAPADPNAPLNLYLQVTLNQVDTGRLAPFVQRQGALSASVATLRDIGFALPDRAPTDTVALDSLPGLAVRYDAALQRLHLDAALSLLSLDTTQLNRPGGLSTQPASASPGVLVNYDLYANRDPLVDNLTASAELRVFGLGDGVFSNTAVSRAFRTREGDTAWRGDTVRLDTSWVLSLPESALSLTVGDGFSGFLDWSRTVRLGGVQVGSDYALQPYRNIAPLPAFLGEASVPSAVDLYVNGIKQYSGNVPPGPFQLSTVPGINGVGNAQVVVTDAFGRTRSISFPFYATQQLLAKGIVDWSAGVGVVREAYGVRSFSYAHDPIANGTVRYGVSDALTLEAHAELGAGVRNGGIGAQWLLGRAGVLNASHARSTLDGLSGSQSSLGYNWNNDRFNLSLQSQRTQGDYRDVAARYGEPPAQISERALAGVNVGFFGNISASYLRLRYASQAQSRYAGLFWNQTLSRRIAANLSVNQNLDDSADRTLFLGLNIALGDNRQSSVSLQRARSQTNAVADVSQPLPGDGDRGSGIGWRLQARTGDGSSGGLAELGLVQPFGRYSAGIANVDGSTSGYGSASGSLVWMGGHVFAARSVTDAFALVSTGRAGVPVKLENRLVGETDANGLLLVTPLRAWQDNRLAINPLDLPANVRIDHIEALATPRDRSGVRADFTVTVVRAAIVVLHDAQGTPLPVGSDVQRSDARGKRTSIGQVGYDGETYLDALQEHESLQIALPEGGSCAVRFDYPAGDIALPRIGPLTCTREAAAP